MDWGSQPDSCRGVSYRTQYYDPIPGRMRRFFHRYTISGTCKDREVTYSMIISKQKHRSVQAGKTSPCEALQGMYDEGGRSREYSGGRQDQAVAEDRWAPAHQVRVTHAIHTQER
jgi:hypothetical protein